MHAAFSDFLMLHFTSFSSHKWISNVSAICILYPQSSNYKYNKFRFGRSVIPNMYEFETAIEKTVSMYGVFKLCFRSWGKILNWGRQEITREKKNGKQWRTVFQNTLIPESSFPLPKFREWGEKRHSGVYKPTSINNCKSILQKLVTAFANYLHSKSLSSALGNPVPWSKEIKIANLVLIGNLGMRLASYM